MGGGVRKKAPPVKRRSLEMLNNGSGEGEQLRLQLILGDIGADDLILDFTVLEEEQERDGLDVVFDRQFACFVDVDLYDFCLTFQLTRELVEDGSDHFAGTAPFRPEIDKDGLFGVDDFRCEIGFCHVSCHA